MSRPRVRAWRAHGCMHEEQAHQVEKGHATDDTVVVVVVVVASARGVFGSETARHGAERLCVGLSS